MTPHRVSRHGSYRLDLVFPGLGRFALASGVTTKKELEDRKAMLRELYRAGDWDVLRDLQARRFTLPQLYAHYRAQTVGQLSAEVVLTQELAAAVTAWLPGSAKAKGTRTRYAVSWRALERARILPTRASIRDLARVDWEQLQASWPGGPYDWRHLRGFISHFLADVLGSVHHPFRTQIMAAFPVGAVPEPRVPDLTPEVFWQIVRAMPEHTRAVPVALVLTGMRVGELLACTDTDLQPLTSSVRIPGQDFRTGDRKSQAAVQPVDPSMWGWIKAAIPFTLSYWALIDHWRQARAQFGVTATLHDLRHCHGQWLVGAGRPEAAVQKSLRHKTATMTRRYTVQVDRGVNAAAIAEILTKSHSGTHSQKSRKSQRGR